MQLLILILASTFVVGSTVVAVHEGWFDRRDEQVLSSTTTFTPVQSAFEELKQPLYFKPAGLKFEKSGVQPAQALKEIKIEDVGLQEDGTLSAPTAWENAGWYVRSAKPGETGNIIIDGHYDTNTGNPAAFWDLKSLSPNDKVLIRDETGIVFTYKIFDIFFVDLDDPDRTRIFDPGTEDSSELTLITCGGVWDSSIGTYDKRLVVKAVLEQF